VLPTLGEVDAVVTDPPYGINHKSNGQLFVTASQISGDENVELAVMVGAATSPTPMVMFFSPYKPLPIKWRSILVWNKGPQVGIGGDRETCWKRDFELIGVRDNGPLNGPRDSAIINIAADVVKPSGHFCEKPVPLMRLLIEKVTQPEKTILDPFMGSGTTGVACIRTRRKFIGIEISREYCDIAIERMERELSQPTLFDPKPAPQTQEEMFQNSQDDVK